MGGADATVLLEDPTCVSAQAEDVLIDLFPACAVWKRVRRDGRAKRGGAKEKPVWLLSGLSFPHTEGITQVPLSCRLQAAAPSKRAGLRLKNPSSKGVKFWWWELRGGVARNGSSNRAVGKQLPEELEKMPQEEVRLLDVSSAFTRNGVKASRQRTTRQLVTRDASSLVNSFFLSQHNRKTGVKVLDPGCSLTSPESF